MRNQSNVTPTNDEAVSVTTEQSRFAAKSHLKISMNGLPRVHILLLNFNGWRDTLECLESVLRLDYPDFRVIVCDNGSSDGSVDRITAWAEGSEPAPKSDIPSLARLVDPPIGKPVPYVSYTRAEAERGGRGNAADDDARL